MLLLYLCNIQIRYLHPIIMLCHILLYLLISNLSTLRFGPRWAKVPWTFSASQPPLNPSRPCQVSHSHDASLRGVWTINIQSPHAMSVQFRCITHDLFVKSWFENDATVPYRTCKIKHDAPLCTCHSKRLDLFLRYSSN